MKDIELFFNEGHATTITSTLLDQLEIIYPKFTPDLSMSDREILFKAGQRSVVDYINYLRTNNDEDLNQDD